MSGIPDELYFFPERIAYEKCGKNVAIANCMQSASECKVHLDFQGIQITSEPDLVNYFKYLVEGNNELYPPTTWEGAKKLYQYIIKSAAPV